MKKRAIYIPEELFNLIKKYAERNNTSFTSVVIAALVSYLSKDPSVVAEIFYERDYEDLSQEEEDLLKQIFEKIPRQERTKERLIELIGEDKFNELLKKGILIEKTYKDNLVYETPFRYYKRISPQLSYKSGSSSSEKEVLSYPLYRKEKEKMITTGEEVPEKETLEKVLVEEILDFIKDRFSDKDQFTLNEIIEECKKKFKELTDKEIELLARAALYNLVVNGEIYFPEEGKIAWA